MGQHHHDKTNRIALGVAGIVMLAFMAQILFYNATPTRSSWEIGFSLGIGCVVFISAWWSVAKNSKMD
jgi:hypothetical protein